MDINKKKDTIKIQNKKVNLIDYIHPNNTHQYF